MLRKTPLFTGLVVSAAISCGGVTPGMAQITTPVPSVSPHFTLFYHEDAEVRIAIPEADPSGPWTMGCLAEVGSQTLAWPSIPESHRGQGALDLGCADGELAVPVDNPDSISVALIPVQSPYNGGPITLTARFINPQGASQLVTLNTYVYQPLDFKTDFHWEVDGKQVTGTQATVAPTAKVRAVLNVINQGGDSRTGKDPQTSIKITLPEGFTYDKDGAAEHPGWSCTQDGQHFACALKPNKKLKGISRFTFTGPSPLPFANGALSYAVTGAQDPMTDPATATVVTHPVVSCPTDGHPTNDHLESTIQFKQEVIRPYTPSAPAPGHTAQPSPRPTPSDTVPIRPESVTPPPVPTLTPGKTPPIKGDGERAARWAKAIVPAGTPMPTVIIGRDDLFADSLASGALQGLLDSPLLLNPKDQLSRETLAALTRYQPKHIVLMGGHEAIGVGVEQDLIGQGYDVTRIQGPTRIETALEVARTYAPNTTTALLTRAYDAQGGSSPQAFADTLGGGAYAARTKQPLLLSTGDRLAESVREYLIDSKIREVTIIGGEEAISPQVALDLRWLSITVTRVAGNNRFETAANLAARAGEPNGSAARYALLVNGEDPQGWTDAFPAALFAGRHHMPVLLTSQSGLPAETAAWLKPGEIRADPIKVVCGYSVNDLTHCTHIPGKE